MFSAFLLVKIANFGHTLPVWLMFFLIFLRYLRNLRNSRKNVNQTGKVWPRLITLTKIKTENISNLIYTTVCGKFKMFYFWKCWLNISYHVFLGFCQLRPLYLIFNFLIWKPMILFLDRHPHKLMLLSALMIFQHLTAR